GVQTCALPILTKITGDNPRVIELLIAINQYRDFQGGISAPKLITAFAINIKIDELVRFVVQQKPNAAYVGRRGRSNQFHGFSQNQFIIPGKSSCASCLRPPQNSDR